MLGLGFCGTVFLGALVGWLASVITGRSERMGCLANVFVGVIGSLLGFFLLELLLPGRQPVVAGFNLYSIAAGTFGAIVFLGITGLFRNRVRL